MKELVDYSGKFDPHFSHDKFTKKTLLKLLKAYSEYVPRIDGFWYLTVMNKWGNNEIRMADRPSKPIQDYRSWRNCRPDTEATLGV